MNKPNNLQNRSAFFIMGTFIVGLYAWLAAVSFGLVLMDILYAGLVPEASKAINESSDFQLLVTGVTILAALGSIWLSRNSSASRNLLAAGLGVIILGFFLYMLLSPFLGEGSASGTVVRIIIYGLTSVLVFLGFYRFIRDDKRGTLNYKL